MRTYRKAALGAAMAAVAVATTTLVGATSAGARTDHDCQDGFVCLYRQDVYWDGANARTMEGSWYYYGAYNLSNEYGLHLIINNHVGGAGIELCTGWNGTGTCTPLVGPYNIVDDMGPYNSIVLYP